MLTVGFVTVPENVTGAPELHVIACDGGFTELVGVTVFMPIVITCKAKQPVNGSITVRVMVLAAFILTELVPAVKEILVQLYESAP
jgi:hypothetical protein